MIRHFSRLFLLSAIGSAALFAAAPASAQLAVFDTSNYAQNLLQASRALEQINHQVQSLQNEATMIKNMARNLKTIDFPELQQMTSAVREVDRLIGEAKAISFRVGDVDLKFKELFPGALDHALKSDERAAAAKARFDAALDGFRHSMAVQAEVVSQIGQDGGLLEQLAGRSQGAEGALQAVQATNQLLALSAKQQMQLQELLAAEFRSASMERSRAAQSEADGRAATRQFLGTGTAYSTSQH